MHFLCCLFHSFLISSLNKPCFILGMQPHTIEKRHTKRKPRRNEPNNKLLIVQFYIVDVPVIRFSISYTLVNREGQLQEIYSTGLDNHVFPAELFFNQLALLGTRRALLEEMHSTSLPSHIFFSSLLFN